MPMEIFQRLHGLQQEGDEHEDSDAVPDLLSPDSSDDEDEDEDKGEDEPPELQPISDSDDGEDEEPALSKRQGRRQERRHEKFRAKQVVESASDTLDLAEADKIVSRLLALGPSGASFIPLTAAAAQHVKDQIEREFHARINALAAPLPERSRFRRTIVEKLAAHPDHLDKSATSQTTMMDACGVNPSYMRDRRRKEKTQSERKVPLYGEKLRGFISADREATSAVERDKIVEWAQTQMSVRSGTHTETFRLTDRKSQLYEKFNAAYARLLRRIHEQDKVLMGNLYQKGPITIFQRNIRRALWLAEQDGFVEGKEADREELSRLRRRMASSEERGPLPKEQVCDFDPATWEHLIHRSPEWFWKTLKEEGFRFRLDKTPYECAVCLGNFDEKLKVAQEKLAVLEGVPEPNAAIAGQILGLRGEVRKLTKQANYLRLHKRQVERQRLYNMEELEDWLREDWQRVKVTTDFGASYFIDGSRYVMHIMWLQYCDTSGDFETQCLYNCVSDPDERSEDAFFTRAVWHHHLRSDGKGSGVLARWKEIVLVRDSGPHFQNNKICYFETTIWETYGFKFWVSAFAKRHGWNECDGAMARVVQAMKAASLEGSPPLDAKDAVEVLALHEKFGNATAYYFEKIDRSEKLFPKLRTFDGIQAKALCEFRYAWTDYDGQEVCEPGYVMARPTTGIGRWVFHDFLPHTRPKAWGKRCIDCSSVRGRAVYHKRPDEPVKVCREASGVRVIVHPDPTELVAADQPVPKSKRQKVVPTGPDTVLCHHCNAVYKNERGVKRHHFSAHAPKVHAHTHTRTCARAPIHKHKTHTHTDTHARARLRTHTHRV